MGQAGFASLSQIPEVCSIKLEGPPYVDSHHDLNLSLDILADNSFYSSEVADKIQCHSSDLALLTFPGFFQKVDKKLKSRLGADFSEAFCVSAFVCAALNRPLKQAFSSAGYMFPPERTHILQSAALLSNFSTKEALSGLKSEEIAGLVSGVLELDTVVRLPISGSVLCFGGMGGDKGYNFSQESKLFSLSTLAAFAASLSGPTHKHHSYPNTSKVAGQTTLEKFGARSDFTSTEDMHEVFDKTSLIMTSCHNTRSIHSLSHVLRGETINHLIGPIAYTIDKDTPVQPFIGVNEKVHPETLINALLIMDRKQIQRYDRGVVLCGLSEPADKISGEIVTQLVSAEAYYKSDVARSLMCLDEVAPPPFATLAGFFKDSSYQGAYIISPQDFYSEDELLEIQIEDLLIPNTFESIMGANHIALEGKDESKARYLAMTIGLANFVRFCLSDPKALNSEERCVNRDMLREQTWAAYSDLKSGRAYVQMQRYCIASNAITNSLNYSR